MDLGATDEQLDSPMVFCSGRNGTASYDWTHPENGTDLKPLFDTILKYVQPPEGEPDEPLQMLVSSVDYNEFVGRMGVGRVQNGVIKGGLQRVRGPHGRGPRAERRHQGGFSRAGLRLAQPRRAYDRPHHQAVRLQGQRP